MKKVLLVGGRAPAALALARAFRSVGHEVIVAETTAWCVCGVSGAVARLERVPWPNRDPLAWESAILSLVRREHIDIVIPTFEEVFYVARMRERLADHCEVLAADLPTLARLHSKWDFIQRVRELGLDAPHTVLLVSQQEARAAVAANPRIVLKPVWSRFSSRALMPPWNEAKLSRAEITREQPWVAQELVSGRGLCTYSVARHGRLTAHAVYPAEFTVGGGTVIAFRHIDHPGCFEWVERVVRAERFHGQIAFDFIEDEGGRLMPIECNPRSTNGVHLFEDGEALARRMLGEDDRLLTPDTGTRVMLSMPMLATFLAHRARDGERWRGTYASSRDVTWTPADPLPLLMQYLGVGWMYWRKLRYGVSLRESATFDLEWNGEGDAGVRSHIPTSSMSPAPR